MLRLRVTVISGAAITIHGRGIIDFSRRKVALWMRLFNLLFFFFFSGVCSIHCLVRFGVGAKKNGV